MWVMYIDDGGKLWVGENGLWTVRDCAMEFISKKEAMEHAVRFYKGSITLSKVVYCKIP